eukprot:GHRR01032551.1.p1 GENE.GHRR01032551.1~~GHRR01032551.1.p1  ORF type:complete len:155 (+),score=4.90 GHRR01032551.1:418-882(+)
MLCAWQLVCMCAISTSALFCRLDLLHRKSAQNSDVAGGPLRYWLWRICPEAYKCVLQVLASLDGRIQLFGAPVAVPSWTHLNATVDITATSIVVNGQVSLTLLRKWSCPQWHMCLLGSRLPHIQHSLGRHVSALALACNSAWGVQQLVTIHSPL